MNIESNDPVMDRTLHAPGLQNMAVLIPCLKRSRLNLWR